MGTSSFAGHSCVKIMVIGTQKTSSFCELREVAAADYAREISKAYRRSRLPTPMTATQSHNAQKTRQKLALKTAVSCKFDYFTARDRPPRAPTSWFFTDD